jgi:hypothetical protein
MDMGKFGGLLKMFGVNPDDIQKQINSGAAEVKTIIDEINGKLDYIMESQNKIAKSLNVELNSNSDLDPNGPDTILKIN